MTGISSLIFPLVYSIPPTGSACKAPRQVSPQLFPSILEVTSFALPENTNATVSRSSTRFLRLSSYKV